MPTAVHLCFGYAPDTIAARVSCAVAEPRLDLGVLADLAGKTIILGVLGGLLTRYWIVAVATPP